MLSYFLFNDRKSAQVKKNTEHISYLNEVQHYFLLIYICPFLSVIFFYKQNNIATIYKDILILSLILLIISLYFFYVAGLV